MCGICGTAGFADADQLEAMNAAMVHRGPDDGGIYVYKKSDGTPWVGLGNRRLSIIDLSSAGHQPMCNEDETVWATYNGETFNFLDLKPGLVQAGHVFRSNTDTEVLIHLYEEHGADCLRRLNGMFGVALWDARKQQLLLARDPFGIKPLYYMAPAEGRLAFASEVKCFIAGGLLKPEVDEEALHYFLNFLWVPGPKTMFRGVHKLPPGHCLLWRDGTYEIKRYWDGAPPATRTTRPQNELVDELRALLRDAVKRHLISDVPLGIFLSGGLDSSSLLALSSQIGNRSMKTYTIRFRSEDSRYEQSDEDPKYARLVARRFGADHHEIEIDPNVVDLLPKIVWHLDEPVADPAAITSYLISKAAREELTVLLSGQGGDEIFGGYRVHLVPHLSRPLRYLPRIVRRNVLLPLWDFLPRFKNAVPGVRPGKVLAYHRYFAKLLRTADYPKGLQYVVYRSYYEPSQQNALYSSDFLAQVRDFDPYATHTRYYADAPDAAFIDQMLYVDQKTFLPELNLTYSDKMSMAASVEARVPLLDQEVARFMRSLEPRYKIDGIKQKYIFKLAMEELLPKSVVWRGKQGFGAPIRRWLNVDLADMVRDLLAPDTVRSRGFFDPQRVQDLFSNGSTDSQDNTYRIWALLTLEMWMRTFVDR